MWSMLLKAALFFLLWLAARRFGNRRVLILLSALCLVLPVLALTLPFEQYWAVVIISALPTMACVFLINILFAKTAENNYAVRYTLFSLLPFPVSLLMPSAGKLATAHPTAFCAVYIALAAATLVITVIWQLKSRREKAA